jgi:phosphohistidine swiveling domain-containing protein
MYQFILTRQNSFIFNSKFSGGKGANLARLTKAGFNVPSFFILSAPLYQHIIQLNRINRFIEKATLEKSLENFQQIKSALLKAAIPESIINQIKSAWKNLIQNYPFKSVAVRSSALAEDLSDHSFAGQLESYLNIQDEKQLLDSIKKCWASLWNERVYHYISTSQAKFRPQPIAVIVQQMIPAESAGICFTLDPTGMKQQWMMIEAHPGIGEKIVGGMVNPVRYRVHRKTLMIQAESDEKQQLFDRQKFYQLAQTCLKIEQYFDAPQDIEWAFYQGQFYILQSRPITTVARKPVSSSEKLWSNYFFGERFPQPVSPLGWSILKPLIEKNAFREPLQFLGFHKLARSRITKCFHGRPYTKLEVFQALHSLFPTDYVLSEKRSLFYDKPVSLHESVIRIFRKIVPIHLRNWKRFLNYYRAKIQSLNQVNLQILPNEQLWQVNLHAEQLSDQLLSLHRWSITFAELIYHFLIFLIRKWLPQMDADQIVVALHRGIPGNKTVEMNIELWNLSRANPFHSPGGELNRYLTDSDGWKSFLEKFGHRSTSLDIAAPTFAEDTNYILEFVQQYFSLPFETSPVMRQKLFEKQREELCQVVYQNLSKQSLGFLKKKFIKILHIWSEQFVLLRENQRYYWHQALAINRKIFLELGMRFFNHGWLAESNHIFLLTRNEIKDIIFSKKFISKIKIEQRQRMHLEWQKVQPPALIDETNSGLADILMTGEKLEGIAASPGVATATARVLKSLDEMAQLQPGEILVVPTTDPGWTPLFGIIKGLVMEVGGVLSHGSIVAREFGIPAVTSVSQATSIIKSGMQITIDGNDGAVWINND